MVKMYASSFDQQISKHGRVVEQALNDARREVAQGRDVVILLNSLTRLARAHNLSSEMWNGPRNQRGGFGSRTLSGGLDIHALEIGRRVFGSARALEEGGSLTIVASCLVLKQVVASMMSSTRSSKGQVIWRFASRVNWQIGGFFLLSTSPFPAPARRSASYPQ